MKNSKKEKIGVEVVTKVIKNILYYADKKTIKKRNDLDYKENDVIFLQCDNGGKENIIKNHLYTELREVYKENDGKNKSLKIDKFTNVFNLPKKLFIYNDSNEYIKKINENINFIKKGLKDNYQWISFAGSVKDKVIIGLGGHSVYETDITFHHTYGIPYIPGQALKGLCRNYIIKEHFENDEEKALEEKTFRSLFGDKNNSGKVIFMDSFPLNDCNIIIERDVMTPHHSDYYSNEKNLPLDSDNPLPIHFLVVKKPKFNFNLGLNKAILQEKFSNDILAKNFLENNFINALKFSGIGAKTSVGYGHFDVNI